MEIKAGMTVRVHQKIKDVTPSGEEKERIQVFEGMVIAVRGAGVSKTMTVRKISNGIGVEKIYPLNMPSIDKIEPIKQAQVRKAKLYYMQGYKKRLKEKTIAPEKK
jgi:large subunit ribosomal protein L19